MSVKKHIPNFITLLNLLCGCMAIVFAFNDNLVFSAYLIGMAAVFDFLDGVAARLLDVKSETGKELDSLADMVSFGIVPSVIMFQLINKSSDAVYVLFSGINILSFAAFFIAVCSALRLAKFNIDTKQISSFIGLPTPANALFIASLPLMLNEPQKYSFWTAYLTDTYFLLLLTCVMSFLLVSSLPLFSLKFKNFSLSGNLIKYILLAVSIVLFLSLGYASVPIIILLYIILSIIGKYLLHEIQSRN